MVNEDWVSKGNASFAHGMKNDLKRKSSECPNNCSLCIRSEESAQTKELAKLWYQQKNKSLVELMVCHTHFEGAQRTHIGWNRIGSLIDDHPFASNFFSFFLICLSAQSIRNRFHIVFLRHNHINNRYFVWEKINSPSENIWLYLFVYRTCSTPSSSIAFSLTVEFVGQKQKWNNKKKLTI